MKRARVFYSGDVQGVGFRFTAVEIARRYQMAGWVKNTADGRVELVAEAKEPALQSFLAELDSAMAYYIRAKNVSWEPATGQLAGFRIEY